MSEIWKGVVRRDKIDRLLQTAGNAVPREGMGLIVVLMLMHDDLADGAVLALAGIVDGHRMTRLQRVMVHRHASIIDNGDFISVSERVLLIIVSRINDGETAIRIGMEVAVEMISKGRERECKGGKGEGEEEFFHGWFWCF